LVAAHISRSNCDEVAGGRPRQPAYEISALNVDFSSPSPNHYIQGALHMQVSNRVTPKKWLRPVFYRC